MIPIDRSGGDSAQEPDAAARVLDAGHLFCIYGGSFTHGTPAKGHTGAARLAVRTGCRSSRSA